MRNKGRKEIHTKFNKTNSYKRKSSPYDGLISKWFEEIL
jgi:hypothetical protein